MLFMSVVESGIEMRSGLALAITAGLLGLNASVAQVMEVSTVLSLQMSGAGTATNINVDGYASKGDGGGGQFVQYNCGGNTDDGGVIIQDPNTSSKCWYRQFSGSVHINWYGVTSASPTATSTQFVNAFKAAKSYGNRTVLTDGLAVSYGSTTANIDIPTGDTLDCQGTIGGFGSGDWTVPTLPASLVIDPSTTIVTTNSRSTLKNCNVRPSWFTTATQMNTTREIIDNVLRNFVGTGAICSDDGCSIQNVAVYGFDVGIRADESQRFYMNNVVVDSNVGVWWRAMAGASKNMNLLVDPVITQGNPDTEEDWSVTNVSADTNGECKLTLGTSPADLHTDSDSGGSDTIWVYGIGATVAIDTTGTWFSGSDTYRTKKPLGLLPTQV
jgi:hypothetical protein